MHSYQLSNGLRVVSEVIPSSRSVALGIWVKTGSRNEDEGNNGISHCIEHMLFKGTDRYSAKEIAVIFDGIGGHLNAFTAKEYTCYYVKVLDEHLPIALEVLASMLYHSAMDAGELAKEKNVILEEIAMYEDTPDDQVHDVAEKAAYGDHALGYSILGNPDCLQQFTPEDLKRYMHEHYVTQNMVISIAGHIDDRCHSWLEQYFGSYQRQGETPIYIPPVMKEQTIFQFKKSEQNHLCLCFQGRSQNSDDLYAMILLNNALGGGMSSRLFQEIRENRGLAYSVYSYHTAHIDSGLHTIYIGSAPAQTDEVLQVTLDLLDQIAHHGLTGEELDQGKQQLKGSLILSLESTSSRMNQMGKNELVLGEHPSLDEVIATIEQLTMSDLNEAIKHVFAGPMSVAMIGQNERILERIKRRNPNGLSSTDEENIRQ